MRFCAGTALAALAALLLAPGAAFAQPVFSIDFQGPPIGGFDSYFGTPITEADILQAPAKNPWPGPMPLPGIVMFGGPGLNPFNLGLPLYPLAVGHPPGLPGKVEVDALSFGTDCAFCPTPAGGPSRCAIFFSVDEFATGIPGPPPNVFSEGVLGTAEAAADVFVVPPMPGMPVGPLPPGLLIPNRDVYDGNGLPSFGGFGYGLIEPNPPTPQMTFDPGSNLDALDVDTASPAGGQPLRQFPVYFSLDASFVDPLEGPPANSGSAAAIGFVGGDVLMTPGPGGPPPILYAPAPLLGLDLINGPDSDDLDALILVENGIAGYQPSLNPFAPDWCQPGGPDMLIFSVRRGSSVIGAPDSIWGAPITAGDLLVPPIPNGLSPFPGIYYPSEALGLAGFTRPFGSPAFPFDDDVDALDSNACFAKPQDIDGDGDVDGTDYGVFSACFNGSGNPYNGATCACFDADRDGDVDGTDYGLFSACFNGAGNPPNC